MDANTIIQLVGSLGFPIVACLGLGFYIYKKDERTSAQIDAMQKEHKDEILKVTEALQENTLAIQKLTDKLDADDGK